MSGILGFAILVLCLCPCVGAVYCVLARKQAWEYPFYMIVSVVVPYLVMAWVAGIYIGLSFVFGDMK